MLAFFGVMLLFIVMSTHVTDYTKKKNNNNKQINKNNNGKKTQLRDKINYAKIESSRMSALHIRAHNIIYIYKV